jgi:hypothetical protein
VPACDLTRSSIDPTDRYRTRDPLVRTSVLTSDSGDIEHLVETMHNHMHANQLVQNYARLESRTASGPRQGPIFGSDEYGCGGKDCGAE